MAGRSSAALRVGSECAVRLDSESSKLRNTMANAPGELRPTATKTRSDHKACGVSRQLHWNVRPRMWHCKA